MSGEQDDVASYLHELDRLSDRTRVASRSEMTGLPLVGWAITWIVGVPAVELLDGIPRIVVVAAAYLTGVLASWWPTDAAIHTGTETPLRRAWFVIFAASPFLLLAARPESFTYGVLLVGGLWGLAMCLYAVATEDWAYAMVAGVGIVAAGAVALPMVSNPLTFYGPIAGVPLLALGVLRMTQGADRV